MRSARLPFVLVAAALLSTPVLADPVRIISINPSGDLVWVNTNMASGTYRVEYKDLLDDAWETVPGLEEVISTTSTTEVPMDLSSVEDHRFFQVVWLNAPLADSFVDFRETQRNNGWQYGYALPATDQPTDPEWFRPMPNYDDGTWSVDETLYWTLISRQTMHPNGTQTSGGKAAIEQWAVLRWTCPIDGPIRVDIVASDLNAAGGNGVIFRLFQDGTERDVHTIENAGQADYSVNLTVNTGQTIDLALDPNQSDDASDVTHYQVRVYKE